MLHILFFYFFCCIASFIQLLVQRLPSNRPFIMCRSSCDGCKERLSFFQTLPIISYFSRKSCPCGIQVPLFYPIIEMLGGLFGLIALLYIELNFLIVLHLISAFVHSLSDYFYLQISPHFFYLTSVVMIVTHIWMTDISAILFLNFITAVFIFIFLSSINYFVKEMIGGGDIKLLLVWGLLLPQLQFFQVIFIASILGIFFIILAKINRLPFIPFLTIGLLISYI